MKMEGYIKKRSETMKLFSTNEFQKRYMILDYTVATITMIADTEKWKDRKTLPFRNV